MASTAVDKHDLLKRRISQAWSYWSQDYDGAAGHGLASELEKAAWLDALARVVGPGPARGGPALRVADVGSGTGIIALLLAELGHDVRGYDMAVGMLERARAKAAAAGLALEFLSGDAEKLPLADGAVDVVINRMVFWIMRQPVVALREWRRVVRPGGRIIVIDGLWGQNSTPRQRLTAPLRAAYYAALRWRERRATAPGPYPYRSWYRDLDNNSPGMKLQSYHAVRRLFARAGLPDTTLGRLPEVERVRSAQRDVFQRVLGITPFYVAIARVE